MKYLFYFLFFTVALSAQNITVLNADTREPVPFVTVILKERQKIVNVFYCSENGTATLNNIIYDTAEFSCVGFDTKTLSDAELDKPVILNPKVLELDEVTISSVRLKDTLIGEYEENKKDKTTIGDSNCYLAVFFENTFGKDVPLRSLWLKLAKIKYTTAVRVHLYNRKDYRQEYFDSKNPDMVYHYDSFIPDKDLYEKNITIYIKPEQGKEVKIDLSGYDIELPKDGAFISLEVLGYFDAAGQTVKTTSPDQVTWIEMHRALNDNFCQKLSPNKYNWNPFWVNINKWRLNDYNVMKILPPKNVFKTPTMGLIVEY